MDRRERSWTLYSKPGGLGYESADGPYPFGTPIRLPEPFGGTVDSGGF
ncbi:hypothetical protein [Streptantibioticus rubrisoli]|uniref:Uncharacterized protein n=1 Tax=Streptantibioticus rubrisoli TaxID=1387313 RepID=A0ABT1PFJ1_9ACTN|nr:hypothetical protein [Streptantibioticus rubrisoli]MCQ4044140.1 hypothetical protein [Streptantibioticus rubrisoli]